MRRPVSFDHLPAHPPGLGLRPATRTWPQRLVLAVGAVTAVACLSASGFVTYQSVRVGDIERLSVSNIIDVGFDQPQNWLLVGVDNRADFQANRTDTIMVVRVDPVGNHVDILSLQRDLWVPIARTGAANRINTAYGDNETPERLIETIKLDFDIDVNHYVEIDFRTFQGVVEAVGGVPMYFDRPMRDRQSGLHVLSAIAGTPPGCVTLDPEQALAFARSRHLEVQEGTRWKDDPSSDYGRISRQQYFLRRLFSRGASKAVNPKTLNDLVSAVNEYVKLDAKVDLDQAAAMFRRFSSFDPEAIKTWTLPTTPVTKPSGAEVLDLVFDGSVPILNIFRGLDPHDADPRLVGFSILNGSGEAGEAAEVQAAFKAIGYRAEVTGNAPTRVARTQVRHGFGGQEVASQIERHLTAGAEVRADPTLEPGQVVLVAGADLTTVMRRPRPWAPLLPAPAPPGEGTTTTTGRPGRASTTTTAEAAPHNTGDSVVGVVPGQPPPGIECS